MMRARPTFFRLIILPNDGRAARNLKLGTGQLLVLVVLAASVLMTLLWIGWEIGALTSRA